MYSTHCSPYAWHLSSSCVASGWPVVSTLASSSAKTVVTGTVAPRTRPARSSGRKQAGA